MVKVYIFVIIRKIGTFHKTAVLLFGQQNNAAYVQVLALSNAVICFVTICPVVTTDTLDTYRILYGYTLLTAKKEDFVYFHLNLLRTNNPKNRHIRYIR